MSDALLRGKLTLDEIRNIMGMAPMPKAIPMKKAEKMEELNNNQSILSIIRNMMVSMHPHDMSLTNELSLHVTDSRLRVTEEDFDLSYVIENGKVSFVATAKTEYGEMFLKQLKEYDLKTELSKP